MMYGLTNFNLYQLDFILPSFKHTEATNVNKYRNYLIRLHIHTYNRILENFLITYA